MKNTTHEKTEDPRRSDSPVVRALGPYLDGVRSLNKESARSHRFAVFLDQALGLEPEFIESYSTGIEQYVKFKHKDRILRGEVDNLFGNVIIEFEANIPATLTDAEEQLRRYAAIVWSGEAPFARTPYVCLATDGVRFRTYTPTVDDPARRSFDPEDIQLQPLEEIDWTEVEPDDVVYWLDRYFARSEILPPSSERVVRDFGAQSHAYQTCTQALLGLWREVKKHSSYAVVYQSWEKYLRVVYGSNIAADELFVKHTYLATLAKLMAWKRVAPEPKWPTDARVVAILEGSVFRAQGIDNSLDEDFFSWVAREDAARVTTSVARKLLRLLQYYDLAKLSEDVLKSLYQGLVDPSTRHDLGEFYTPDWLAHRMVRKLLAENPSASMFDPACGSGTFL